MGVQLIAHNTVAPWYTKVAPPVTRGLEGWFTLDTDVRRFGFNRVPGKADATIVGAPAAFVSHGRFKGNINYLQTQIEDTDEVTLIVVGRSVLSPVGNDAVFLAGAHSGPILTPGFTGSASAANIYLDHATAAKGSASRNDGAGASTPANVTITGVPGPTWALRSVRAKTGAATVMVDHTANVTVTGSNVNQRVLTTNKYRIGSAAAGFPGECDVSFMAVHSATLTDSELAAQIAVIRKRMARLGITV